MALEEPEQNIGLLIVGPGKWNTPGVEITLFLHVLRTSAEKIYLSEELSTFISHMSDTNFTCPGKLDSL